MPPVHSRWIGVLPTRSALNDGSCVMMSGSGYVTGCEKSRGGFEMTLGGSAFLRRSAHAATLRGDAARHARHHAALPILIKSLTTRKHPVSDLLFVLVLLLYRKDFFQAFEEHVDDARIEVLPLAVAQ